MSISWHSVSVSALRTCSMCSISHVISPQYWTSFFSLSSTHSDIWISSVRWWCCCCYCVVCISIQQHTCSHQPPESRSVHLLRSLPAIITVKLSYRNSDTRRMCCLCCCVVPLSHTRTLLLLFKIRLLRCIVWQHCLYWRKESQKALHLHVN